MSVNHEKLGEFDPLDSSQVSPDFYILGQNRQKTVPFFYLYFLLLHLIYSLCRPHSRTKGLA